MPYNYIALNTIRAHTTIAAVLGGGKHLEEELPETDLQ